MTVEIQLSFIQYSEGDRISVFGCTFGFFTHKLLEDSGEIVQHLATTDLYRFLMPQGFVKLSSVPKFTVKSCNETGKRK